MSTQKLQVGRALQVIPSDNCDVPFPAATTTGSNTSVVANRLVDSTKDFIALNVSPGDIVYNTSSSLAATVVRVVSATTIELNANIFATSPLSYTLYAEGNNDGCVLFVGTAGNLTIETVGGDTVTFVGISGGQFIPVHIKKVLSGGTIAGGLIAMW